jgi:multiple antibiotic resistance protein
VAPRTGGGETTLGTIISALVALLAITNPIGAVPVFLEITQGSDASERRRDALRASLTVVLILAVAVVGGQAILGFFGISVNALRTAGGLIIVMMGIEMLGGSVPRLQSHQGGPATSGDDENEDVEDSLVVPFAMPLVAGPGAIATAVTLAAKADSLLGTGEMLIAVVAVGLILFVALAFANVIGTRISRRGHAILMRFLGLILTSIGVMYLLEGAQAVLRSTGT